jgi:hypothetical protein
MPVFAQISGGKQQQQAGKKQGVPLCKACGESL